LAEPVAEPVLETAAPAPQPKAAPAPRAPDPAEISTPPTAPRKGWWRRG
ncbi:MAG: ribonuclease, partial [Phenylobacterium sp.]|nr:ribonuclease [Phenylobacterium sp.]